MNGGSSRAADRIGCASWERRLNMGYFAGLDVSMEATHVCVLSRKGAVVHKITMPSTPASIAAAPGASSGLSAGPVPNRPDCADALPWLAPARVARRLDRASAGLPGTEAVSTAQDRPRRRPRPGASRFFKPVHVKSLSAHAICSLITARKRLVGQRVTRENQIRGLAVVFGVRLSYPREGA